MNFGLGLYEPKSVVHQTREQALARARDEAQARVRASQPDAIVASQARNDERIDRARARARARLSRAMRGGLYVARNDAALSRVGFRLPFIRPESERSSYFSFWHNIDGARVAQAARAAARSVRSGRVSDTSRDEAQAAARQVFIVAAAGDPYPDVIASNDGNGGIVWDWLPGGEYRRVCSLSSVIGAAVASARASLRGDALGGGTTKNGVIRGRAVANDEGNGGLVWSMDRGDWIKVKRVDGAEFFDLAGRIICEGRGGADADSMARSRDAVRLVGWLIRRRIFALSAKRGQAVPACTVARIRQGAAKVARVLRGLARGESLPLACKASGLSPANDCRAWRKAIAALACGQSIVEAARDWRASDLLSAIALPVSSPVPFPVATIAAVTRCEDSPAVRPYRASLRLAGGQTVRMIQAHTRAAFRRLAVALRKLA
ncbi:MAG: hypothetical protein QOF48_3716 [Verrucomicrobiota bacterium]